MTKDEVVSIARGVTKAVLGHLTKALGHYAKRFDALEGECALLHNRLARIEAQPKALEYKGGWEPGATYERNDVVTFAGSMWVAKDKNIVRPSDPELGPRAWQLCVRRGKDGREGKDA